MPRGGYTRKPTYIPTPAQIRAECARIQAEWSEDEEYSRRFRLSPDDGAYTVPSLSVSLGGNKMFRNMGHTRAPGRAYGDDDEDYE